MKLLSSLGINWKLLLAQLVNFLILLYILKRFAYKPILKVLEDRKNRIEKGIKDTEEAKIKLEEIEKKEKTVLLKAEKKAQGIINSAQEVAYKNKKDIIAKSNLQAREILEKAKKEIKEEKDKMLEEAKTEIVELTFLITEKLIEEKMNGEKDKQFIGKIIKSAWEQKQLKQKIRY